VKATPFVLALCALAFTGCSKKSPTPSGMLAPTPGTTSSTILGAAPVATSPAIGKPAPARPASGRPDPGKPGYELAYEDGRELTINAISIPGKVAPQAQADFYEVVYPPDWQALGIPAPQCNPCDHDGNGIDPGDFHDHVLDSAHGDPGFHTAWHVYVLAPAYTGNASHDAELGQLYKAHLPLKSEADVEAFGAMKLSDGSPTAAMIDTHFFFLCAIVNPHAAGH
jgi:hypothetical protein